MIVESWFAINMFMGTSGSLSFAFFIIMERQQSSSCIWKWQISLVWSEQIPTPLHYTTMGHICNEALINIGSISKFSDILRITLSDQELLARMSHMATMQKFMAMEGRCKTGLNVGWGSNIFSCVNLVKKHKQEAK